MLVVTDNEVEAAVGVDLALERDAVLDLFKGLSNQFYVVLAVFGAGQASLSVRRRVKLIEVEPFDLLLQDVDDLLPCVLFVLRVAATWLGLEVAVV